MTALPNTPDRLTSVPAAPFERVRPREMGMPIALPILVLLVAGVLAALALLNALAYRDTPFSGALFTRTLVIDGTRPIDGAWNGLSAGLLRGDRIVAIDGRAVSSTSDYAAQLTNVAIGRRVELSVLRALDGRASLPGCDAAQDGRALCRLDVTLDRLPDGDFVALFVIPFFSGIVALAIGVGVLWARRREQYARGIALVNGLIAVFLFGLFDLNTSYVLTPVWIIGTCALGAAAVTLAINFPMKLGIFYRRPWLVYLPPVTALIAAAVALWLFFFPPTPGSVLIAFQISSFVALGATLLSSLLWVRQRARATTPIVRDQANLTLIGFLFAVAPGMIYAINIVARILGSGQEVIPFNTSAIAPFFMLPAFGMAYAGLQTRAIDADVWVSRGITYTFLAVALILGYFLLVFVGAIFLVGMTPNNPLLVAVAIFVVAVVFVPLRTRLQGQIDKLYFRRRLVYGEQVEKFARSISALRNLDEITDQYRGTLETTLAPSHCVIFLHNILSDDYSAFSTSGSSETDLRFMSDSPLVEFLRGQDSLVIMDRQFVWAESMVAEKARLNVLKPALLVGFRGSNRLNGFAVIGAPRSGASQYNYDEQNFVENLSNQMTIAVERAQVVVSLERRVKELDILSKVSEAVNFTGDFDQLLELIATQIIRLIPTTHIYIALRDPAMNELYYAFFQENDERYPDREGERWTIANDLVSEVARGGTALRVSLFVRAMAERGAKIVREDDALKAWMGVPLLTGSRVLGVLSIGSREASRPFSEDEMRLLKDVGALAATSLDKARLFAETNLRARQLAALNDISRKLVAAEMNLDNLLQLITQSACDILNAEAGAVLLADDNGDLEYTVTTGSGVEVIGTRVGAGEGILGEVASSGSVIFINEEDNDPRLLTIRLRDNTPPRSLLAAPLMTQKRIIGVVQIINRIDKGFVKEDADLLTTFAGQAAVAIENARLFQLTDQQLRDRLEELETLERIDAEMNRSLDVAAVSEIALRFAMSETEATAGVVGLVDGEAMRLNLVASVGYTPEDLGGGATAESWPLDNGIASRAYRTKRAELIPDVAADPLFVPSLREAKSQISVPMLSGTDVIAMLVLESNQEGKLRLADMPFVQRLAEHASIAIANAQLYAQLSRANQSKSEFVSFVAHELKNPLTSIKGYADVLVTGAVGGLSDMQRNFISTIRSNAERMNTLVSDLNDVTKLQTDNLSITPEVINLRDLLDETVRGLQKQLEDKAQTLVMELEEDVPDIYVDRVRLIQVLTNLISNANKYSPPETSIIVRAEAALGKRNVEGKQKHMLHVSVRDQGIGMTEEDINRLFTPYFRSDNPSAREQPGTGLGLTITRGIIERHGGEIWLESKFGEGTTFHFSVPLPE